ncbi:MAG TPA: ThuA domain-containing protein, partial [Acidimicrobiales bacterium]
HQPYTPRVPERMLIVTQVAPYADGPAGVHGVLGQAATALGQLAESAGLSPVIVRDVRDLSTHQLGSARVLALFTIGETPFTASQREALLSSWRSGRVGVLGVHSATDACHRWPEYGSVIGGRFDGHPWTQDFEVAVVDPDHPATAHLGERWRWHDEIYLFHSLRPDARVLLRLADGQVDLAVPGGRVPACGFPLAWCHTEAEGRTFYSALGHFPGAWETPAYLRHLAGGLAWLTGDA